MEVDFLKESDAMSNAIRFVIRRKLLYKGSLDSRVLLDGFVKILSDLVQSSGFFGVDGFDVCEFVWGFFTLSL